MVRQNYFTLNAQAIDGKCKSIQQQHCLINEPCLRA